MINKSIFNSLILIHAKLQQEKLARKIAKKRVDAAIAYRRMEGQENMSKSLTLG